MKKLLLAFLLFPFLSFAQTDTSKIERYCMVVAQPRAFSTKVNITVDYGEEIKFFSGKDLTVRDESGKLKKFNTVIDALNYMANQGWKLHSTLQVTTAGTTTVVHQYIFRREFLRSYFSAEATAKD